MSDPYELFVHQANIRHFQKILKTEADTGKKQRVQALLAKEKLKLAEYHKERATRALP